MRWAALVLAGCGGAAAPPAIANAPAPEEEKSAAAYYNEAVKLDHIECPEGTTQEGEDPPHGDYAYCVLPDGTRHGPWMTWPALGNVRKIAIEDHGTIVFWQAWHASNDTLATVIDAERELHWHDNGQLAFDGRVIDNVPRGRCRAWDRDGTLIFDEIVDGTGVIITWHEDKRVQESWKDGVRHGEHKRWYASGVIEEIETWEDGERVEHQKYLPDGTPEPYEEPWCAHGPCDYMPE